MDQDTSPLPRASAGLHPERFITLFHAILAHAYTYPIDPNTQQRIDRLVEISPASLIMAGGAVEQNRWRSGLQLQWMSVQAAKQRLLALFRDLTSTGHLSWYRKGGDYYASSLEQQEATSLLEEFNVFLNHAEEWLTTLLDASTAENLIDVFNRHPSFPKGNDIGFDRLKLIPLLDEQKIPTLGWDAAISVLLDESPTSRYPVQRQPDEWPSRKRPPEAVLL